MVCFENREEWINHYLDGELDPAEERRFQEHLAGCPSCQQEVARARLLFGLIEGLPDAPVPDGFLGDVLAGLAPAPARRLTRWILPVQAVAALLLLGLAYPRWAGWYERFGAWLTPGWLSSQLTRVAAWAHDTWSWLVGWLRGGLGWSWPQGFGLAWPQATLMAVALIGLWWLGNRLLLTPGQNERGGTS